MAEPIEPGRKAPDFTLNDQHGRPRRLSEFRGQTVVLYFYPKDDTPACTAEACDFQEGLTELGELDAVVIGVSPDDVDSHRRFAEKYGLAFPLLADPPGRNGEPRIAARYGVWREKLNYGKTYVGLVRTTYIIDPDGRVRHRFDNVRAKGHVGRVRRWLRENA